MTIVLELVNALLVAVIFEFLLYSTGVLLMRALSFGKLALPLYKYGQFKTLKETSNGGTFLPSSIGLLFYICLLYTSPSPRDRTRSRMPSSA